MRHPILAALLLVPVVGRSSEADGVSIDHKPVGCVVVERFSKIEARFDPAADVARSRVHFRAAGGPYWYFVEMRPEPGVFYGVLPKPKKETKKIEYYVEVLDKAFAASRTAEYAPDVVEPGTCRKDALMAAVLTTAKVAVGAATGAPVVPLGFSAAGIVPVTAAGTAAGASAGTGGATGTGAAGAGAAGTGAAGGISTGVVVGVVGAGAAVAAVAATAGGGESSGTSAPATTAPSGTAPTTTSPPATPTTTAPTPTTTVPPAGVTGRWVGTPPDGFATADGVTGDLSMDLVQTGTTVNGSLGLVVRTACPQPDCTPVGTQFNGPVSGGLNGSAITLSGTMTTTTPNEPPATLTLSGTLVSATRMSGTLTVPNEPAGGGTWAVNKQ